MGGFVATRRAHLRVKGRPMLLARVGGASVTVQGLLRHYAPQQVTGAIRQGDAQLFIGNDEIAAAAWPAPPIARDRVTVDGFVWTIEGAEAVWDGAVLAGWNLWIRGG